MKIRNIPYGLYIIYIGVILQLLSCFFVLGTKNTLLIIGFLCVCIGVLLHIILLKKRNKY